MLVFFKYAQIYTSIQMYILYVHIYNNNSHYFSLSKHFIHIDDSVSVLLRYLKKTETSY